MHRRVRKVAAGASYTEEAHPFWFVSRMKNPDFDFRTYARPILNILGNRYFDLAITNSSPVAFFHGWT